MFLIFFGPQGVGKGTQAKIFADKFQIPHISTGDIFRENITNKTPLGQKVSEIINKGELVSDELTNELVENRLLQEDAQKGFILDGYPRNLKQAENLDNWLKENNKSLDRVIYLSADRTKIIKRIEERARIEKRSDDTKEAIEKRLDEFDKQTLPLVDFYSKQGLISEVDGGNNINVVSDRIETFLELLAD